MYIWTVVSVGSLLVCLYSMTLYKAIVGTRFIFVICLSATLMVSNLGSVCAVLTAHWADLLLADYTKGFPAATIDLEKFTTLINFETIAVVLRDGCLNEAVWIFSFRYWIISFLMPWQMK